MKKSVQSKYRQEYHGSFKFDYKDPVTLFRFIMESGKIIPSRVSKLSNIQQKAVANAVKRGRNLSLLPIGSHAYDTNGRPSQISATPFEY